MPDSFFDSNVLLYLASDDEVKATRAEDLMRSGGTISVQVLNEVTSVGRRKMQMPWPDLHRMLEALRAALHVVPVTTNVHEEGLVLARRYSFSIYDAMIVSAALLAGCDQLWSEDMQHGLIVADSLHIVNPFRSGK